MKRVLICAASMALVAGAAQGQLFVSDHLPDVIGFITEAQTNYCQEDFDSTNRLIEAANGTSVTYGSVIWNALRKNRSSICSAQRGENSPCEGIRNAFPGGDLVMQGVLDGREDHVALTVSDYRDAPNQEWETLISHKVRGYWRIGDLTNSAQQSRFEDAVEQAMLYRGRRVPIHAEVALTSDYSNVAYVFMDGKCFSFDPPTDGE